jgi:chromate transporter
MIDDTLIQLAALFTRLSVIGFGGNDAILAEMQRQAVQLGWMTTAQFAEAYALSRIAPGPGGLLPVMGGYRAAGLAGAGVALLSYIGPTVLIAMLCAQYLRGAKDQRWPGAIRRSVTPVSVGLLLAAVYVLFTLVVHDAAGALIAVAAGGATLAGRVPVALVPIAAATIGILFLT